MIAVILSAGTPAPALANGTIEGWAGGRIGGNVRFAYRTLPVVPSTRFGPTHRVALRTQDEPAMIEGEPREEPGEAKLPGGAFYTTPQRPRAGHFSASLPGCPSERAGKTLVFAACTTAYEVWLSIRRRHRWERCSTEWLVSLPEGETVSFYSIVNAKSELVLVPLAERKHKHELTIEPGQLACALEHARPEPQ